jgi:hypothetical protein
MIDMLSNNTENNLNIRPKYMAINIYIPWNIWQIATAFNNYL